MRAVDLEDYSFPLKGYSVEQQGPCDQLSLMGFSSYKHSLDENLFEVLIGFSTLARLF